MFGITEWSPEKSNRHDFETNTPVLFSTQSDCQAVPTEQGRRLTRRFILGETFICGSSLAKVGKILSPKFRNSLLSHDIFD